MRYLILIGAILLCINIGCDTKSTEPSYSPAGGYWVRGPAGLEIARKCAKEGDPNWQYALGNALERGEHVLENYEESAFWWHKAAQQGHSKAQFELGKAFSMGQGVPEDHRQSVRWLKKSALQQNIDAMYWLGCNYNFGSTGVLNEPEAYAWLLMVKLYAEEDHYHLKTSLRQLERLRYSLSPEQMSVAQKRAAELQKEIDAFESASEEKQ